MMIPLPDLEMENICILHVIVKHTIERVNTKQGAPQNIEVFLHGNWKKKKDKAWLSITASQIFWKRCKYLMEAMFPNCAHSGHFPRPRMSLFCNFFLSSVFGVRSVSSLYGRENWSINKRNPSFVRS